MKRLNFHLLLIIGIGVALRILCFVGLNSVDPYFYANYAFQILDGSFKIGMSQPLEVFMFRNTILIPTAMFFRLFGINKISAVLLPFLLSIGEIVVIFYLGKALFNKRVGMISALLLSFLPMHVVYATQLFPDIIISFFLGAAALLFLKGENNDSLASSIVWYSFSGLMIYFAYGARETSAVVAFIILLIYSIYSKKIRLLRGFAIIAFLVPVICTWFWHWNRTGDFFFEWNLLSKIYVYAFSCKYLFYYISKVMLPLLSPYKVIPDGFYMFGFFYYFVFTYIIYYFISAILIKKNETKNMNFCITWFLSLYLFLEFNVVADVTWGVLRYSRFLSPLTIPGILILAIFLTGLTENNGVFHKIALWVTQRTYRQVKNAVILLLVFLIGSGLFLFFGRELLLSILTNIYGRGKHILTFDSNYLGVISLYYLSYTVLLAFTVGAIGILWKLSKNGHLDIPGIKRAMMWFVICFLLVTWGFLGIKKASILRGFGSPVTGLPVFKLLHNAH